LNKYDLAYQYYQKALGIKPDQSRFNYNMGQVCIALDRVDEAIKHFEKVSEIDPEISEGLYYNLALLYAKKKDWKSAYLNMENIFRNILRIGMIRMGGTSWRAELAGWAG